MVKDAIMWQVYILRCMNDSLYTGITKDVKRRFSEHQRKGARYTSYNPPVKVVYKEALRTRSQALKREAEIKSWTRAKKLDLIRGERGRLQKGG